MPAGRALPAWVPGVVRALGAVLGGYVFCAVVIALSALLLVHAGLQASDAVVASSMLGFLVYLVVLIWAFSVPRLRTLYLGLAAGTALCCAMLIWLG